MEGSGAGGLDDFLSDIEEALQDPRFVGLTRRTAEVVDWEPDAPRVAELATWPSTTWPIPRNSGS